MIWAPLMIVTWVRFDPAVSKKQMKSDLGCIGRKYQIQSTFPCFYLDTDVDEWIYQLQAALYTCWHLLSKTSRQLHPDNNHSSTEKCLQCVFVCLFVTVQVTLPSSQRWSLDKLCPSYASSYMVPFSLSSYVLRYMALFSILSCLWREQMFAKWSVIK